MPDRQFYIKFYFGGPKMKKKLFKAFMLSAAAVALVVATVFATLAFLADSSAVSNTFTVGNVGIDMKETAVDENGKPIEGAAKVDGNSYHLRPENTYTKDPTITIETTNANDEMFLFVKTNNMIRGVEAGNLTGADASTPKTMRQQMEANGWVEFIQSGDKVEIVWVYGTRAANGVITPTAVNCNSEQKDVNGNDVAGVDAGEFRLCENFTIGNVDGAQLNLYGGTTVTFTGFAIQTSHVDDDSDNTLVKAAWKNIKDTFPVNCNIIDPVNPYNGVKGDGAYAPVPKNQQTDN